METSNPGADEMSGEFTPVVSRKKAKNLKKGPPREAAGYSRPTPPPRHQKQNYSRNTAPPETFPPLHHVPGNYRSNANQKQKHYTVPANHRNSNLSGGYTSTQKNIREPTITPVSATPKLNSGQVPSQKIVAANQQQKYHTVSATHQNSNLSRGYTSTPIQENIREPTTTSVPATHKLNSGQLPSQEIAEEPNQKQKYFTVSATHQNSSFSRGYTSTPVQENFREPTVTPVPATPKLNSGKAPSQKIAEVNSYLPMQNPSNHCSGSIPPKTDLSKPTNISVPCSSNQISGTVPPKKDSSKPTNISVPCSSNQISGTAPPKKDSSKPTNISVPGSSNQISGPVPPQKNVEPTTTSVADTPVEINATIHNQTDITSKSVSPLKDLKPKTTNSESETVKLPIESCNATLQQSNTEKVLIPSIVDAISINVQPDLDSGVSQQNHNLSVSSSSSDSKITVKMPGASTYTNSVMPPFNTELETSTVPQPVISNVSSHSSTTLPCSSETGQSSLKNGQSSSPYPHSSAQPHSSERGPSGSDDPAKISLLKKSECPQNQNSVTEHTATSQKSSNQQNIACNSTTKNDSTQNTSKNEANKNTSLDKNEDSGFATLGTTESDETKNQINSTVTFTCQIRMAEEIDSGTQERNQISNTNTTGNTKPPEKRKTYRKYARHEENLSYESSSDSSLRGARSKTRSRGSQQGRGRKTKQTNYFAARFSQNQNIPEFIPRPEVGAYGGHESYMQVPQGPYYPPAEFSSHQNTVQQTSSLAGATGTGMANTVFIPHLAYMPPPVPHQNVMCAELYNSGNYVYQYVPEPQKTCFMPEPPPQNIQAPAPVPASPQKMEYAPSASLNTSGNGNKIAMDSVDPEFEDTHSRITKELKCSLCSNYMLPPIYFCSNGHAACSNCRTDMNLCYICNNLYSTNPIILDNIVRNYNFPCRYREKGCMIILPADEMADHENICEKGTYTQCILNFEFREGCVWLGLYSELKNHFHDFHGGKITRSTLYHTTHWGPKTIFLSAYKELFIYHKNIRRDDTISGKNISHCFVQHVGPQSLTNQFHAKFKVCAGLGEEEWANEVDVKVFNIRTPLEVIYHSGKTLNFTSESQNRNTILQRHICMDIVKVYH